MNRDDGKYTANIFIDLKKAFDTVDHDILLAKLRKYGVDNLELAWFTSYLTNRKQFCKVKRDMFQNYRYSMWCAPGFLSWPSFVSDLYQ